MPRANPAVKIGRRGVAHWTHGRDNAYKNGCRCDECRHAHTLAVRARRGVEDFCGRCGRWYTGIAEHDTKCAQRDRR
jgi:hypothetical protein